MSSNFDHTSRKEVSHYEEIVKMSQFYSDSYRFFFFLQPTVYYLREKHVNQNKRIEKKTRDLFIFSWSP
jgi:hypothetical protein